MRVAEDSPGTHPLGTEKHEKQKENQCLFVWIVVLFCAVQCTKERRSIPFSVFDSRLRHFAFFLN